MLNDIAYESLLQDRSKFIEKNMPLVGYVTARFMGRGYEYEDLYQYGCIGLIKAVDRFDPEYGVAFSTYAVPLIIGEIRRFLRSDGVIHISRTIKENVVKVMSVLNSVENEEGKITVDQISEKTGLEKQETLLALTAMLPVKSLQAPVSADGELMLQDTLGKDDRERTNNEIALKQALGNLSEKEKELIDRRYYKHQTQAAIAEEFGITQVQVSRMEKKTIEKLRKMLL